ncbi:MAG: hypothetical protein GXC70_13405, partial [Sphingomonadaceae bacterium]|nr:hypothetical protein [Sphingomonadaceae bacterium]
MPLLRARDDRRLLQCCNPAAIRRNPEGRDRYCAAGLYGVTLPGKPDPQLANAGSFAQPSPSPSATAAPASGALLEQQVAALEQRLARIDLQAAAAEGNTARAEALLVALAARRAID